MDKPYCNEEIILRYVLRRLGEDVSAGVLHAELRMALKALDGVIGNLERDTIIRTMFGEGGAAC